PHCARAVGRAFDAKMLAVPLIQCFGVFSLEEDSAQSYHSFHAPSHGQTLEPYLNTLRRCLISTALAFAKPRAHDGHESECRQLLGQRADAIVPNGNPGLPEWPQVHQSAGTFPVPSRAVKMAPARFDKEILGKLGS